MPCQWDNTLLSPPWPSLPLHMFPIQAQLKSWDFRSRSCLPLCAGNDGAPPLSVFLSTSPLSPVPLKTSSKKSFECNKGSSNWKNGAESVRCWWHAGLHVVGWGTQPAPVLGESTAGLGSSQSHRYQPTSEQGNISLCLRTLLSVIATRSNF